MVGSAHERDRAGVLAQRQILVAAQPKARFEARPASRVGVAPRLWLPLGAGFAPGLNNGVEVAALRVGDGLTGLRFKRADSGVQVAPRLAGAALARLKLTLSLRQLAHLRLKQLGAAHHPINLVQVAQVLYRAAGAGR